MHGTTVLVDRRHSMGGTNSYYSLQLHSHRCGNVRHIRFEECQTCRSFATIAFFFSHAMKSIRQDTVKLNCQKVEKMNIKSSLFKDSRSFQRLDEDSDGTISGRGVHFGTANDLRLGRYCLIDGFP